MQKWSALNELKSIYFPCQKCKSSFKFTSVLIKHVIKSTSIELIKNECYLCSQCYQDLHMPLAYIPLSQIIGKFLSKLPLPIYKPAEDCLRLVEEIETKCKEICNKIEKQIDQFKFQLWSFTAKVRDKCNQFIQKLKYFQQGLRIFDFIELLTTKTLNQPQNQKKSAFTMNQQQNLVQICESFKQLTNILKKVSTIELRIDPFDHFLTHKQFDKNLFQQIPISSVTVLNGNPYFGLSDGKILVSTHSGIKSYKAHDSLIRSFAQDSQFSLYSGSDDFKIKRWDTRMNSLVCMRVFGILGQENKSYHRGICVLEQNSEGKGLLVSTRGQYDGFRIRVWNLQKDFRNIGVLEGHSSFIRAIATIDHRDKLIVTASDDKTIQKWQLPNQKSILTGLRQKKPIHIVVSSPKFRLVCIFQESRACILDEQSFSPILSFSFLRKILCVCGFSKQYLGDNNRENDYLVIYVAGSIGMYSWSGQKVWSSEMDISFIPMTITQYGNKLFIVDSSGIIQIIKVDILAF